MHMHHLLVQPIMFGSLSETADQGRIASQVNSPGSSLLIGVLIQTCICRLRRIIGAIGLVWFLET